MDNFNKNIKKYIFGEPIFTDAVVQNIKPSSDDIDIVTVSDDSIFYKMSDDEIVYGLGQSVRGLNKRGFIYNSNCSDEPTHTEDKSSLYGAHNFLLVSGKKSFGIFIDTPSEVEFDIGFSNYEKLVIKPKYVDFVLYLITGENAYDIVKRFRKMIGKSYIPPKWAFGYGQSRWGYKTKEDILEVVNNHRDNGIPLDMVYLDIDYMKDFKNFTIDEEAFPEFEQFIKEMKDRNIHLIPIIDAGCKVQKGYDVYDEGIEKGYFCKKADGKEIVCGVWPGAVHFPDFLNSEARDWFGNKYKKLIDKGIDGFWNDMNEPAIFYTDEQLDYVFDEIEKYKTQNLDIYSFFAFKDLIQSLPNNKKYYEQFYHNYDGKVYRHDKVHNLYGAFMTRAAGEVFEKMDKDILLFSRASYIGAHRYGGIWQGDNHSWWSHLKMNIHMTMSLNMVGFLFTGADIGGFGSSVSEDLMARWLQFAIFTPLMRNHSALGNRPQEVYQFANMETLKNIIEVRYRLIPYIYDEFVKAVCNDEMYMRPIAFDYPDDDMAKKVEDQAFVGDSIMIAPVYEQNAKGRYVYFPDDMKMLKIISNEQIIEKIYTKGQYYIDIAIDEVVIFIRKDKKICLSDGGKCINELDWGGNLLYSFY